jgi:hypothetical protein
VALGLDLRAAVLRYDGTNCVSVLIEKAAGSCVAVGLNEGCVAAQVGK